MPHAATLNPLLALAMGLYLVSGLLGSVRCGSLAVQPRTMALWVSAAATGLAFALAATLLSGVPAGFLGAGATGISSVFACTVTLLAFTIFKVSYRALHRDRAEADFYRFAQLALASILGIAASGSLFLAIAFWCISGVAVHRLLTLYPERKRAHYSARKKVVANRVGNSFGILACGLLFLQSGFVSWSEMGSVAPGAPAAGAAALLIALAALVKSAQAPFQTWLPETLEAPTPVSALLHAGVLNSGGFLLLQSWPLLAGVSLARETLCVVGALTVVTSGLTMLTAADQKRRLAHSTSAQLGFMMLQVGLGVPEAALLHMMGHALYKAHAFLTSSRLQSEGHPVQVKTRGLRPSLVTAAGVIILGLGPVWLHAAGLAGETPFARSTAASLLCTAALSGIWLSSQHLRGERLTSLAFTLLICGGAALTMWGGSSLALLPQLSSADATGGSPAHAVSLITWVAFAMLFLFQTSLPWLNANCRHTPVFITLKNGFYFETIWRRIVRT